MKNTMKSILIFLLAAYIMIFSESPAMASNTVKRIDYMAFGDSCAAGVLWGDPNYPDGGSGLGYTDDIANNLKKAGVLGSFDKQFAVSGKTAEKLAKETAVLSNPKTSQSRLAKNAEIITLTIGADDLLIPFYSYVMPLMADPGSDWYNNQPKVANHIAAVILPQIKKELYSGKGLKIKHNIEIILQNILKANKKAKIYVMGYYNPLPLLWSDNAPVVYLNKCIGNAASSVASKNKSASITYVETMSVMKNPEYLFPTDIHPTAAGYQAIADEFWKHIAPAVLKKSR